MDWGYESETGQVWLFNVTPFTPHLPHWQHAFVCAFLLLYKVVLFVCILVCVWAHTCTFFACFFAVNTESSMWPTYQLVFRDVVARSCSLTWTFSTLPPLMHTCTHFGQALNCMNNETDRQTVWNTCFSETCIKSVLGLGYKDEGGWKWVFMRHGISSTLQGGMTWMQVSLFQSLLLCLSHIFVTPSTIPTLLICVKLNLSISGEMKIILWRDGARWAD